MNFDSILMVRILIGRTHFIALANIANLYIVINKILLNFKDYCNNVIFIICGIDLLINDMYFQTKSVAKIKKETGRKFYLNQISRKKE